MTFSDFCDRHDLTPPERAVVREYLVLVRMRAFVRAVADWLRDDDNDATYEHGAGI